MRLPATAHTSRPWQIHDLRPQLAVLDVWSLNTPGDSDDFPRLVQLVTAFNPAKTPAPVRLLFAIRSKLGGLLRLDSEPVTDEFPFTTILENDREWAGELSNRTVDGVLHLGWVPDQEGSYRGQLTVLVKPKGLLGRVYLAGIAPFRHLIVYPMLLRDFERRWSLRSADRGWRVLGPDLP
jgi:uncharacterized protein DUF2867